MSELPFDPYESGSTASRHQTDASHLKPDLDEDWLAATQIKAWFFGWLFYSFGLVLLAAFVIRAFSDVDGGNTFAIGLISMCAWIACFLQYRFPIGGPRLAPSRMERRAKALGPGYSLSKALLGGGVLLGIVTSVISDILDSSVGTIVYLVGQVLAFGSIVFGRRLMSSAKRRTAESMLS